MVPVGLVKLHDADAALHGDLRDIQWFGPLIVFANRQQDDNRVLILPWRHGRRLWRDAGLLVLIEIDWRIRARLFAYDIK